MTVAYSRGRDKFDAHPAQRTAATFDDFERAVLADRAPAKGRTYIAAPFRRNGDGRPHRCKEGALPRAWLAFDLDGVRDAATLVDLCLLLQRFRGFCYTTWSHRPEVPRVRLILATTRPADRAECQRVSLAIEAAIRRELGDDAAKFDRSVYRGEQPCYLAPADATTYRFDGAPVDVDATLQTAPLLDDERPGVSDRARDAAERDPIMRHLVDNGMVKRELEPGRFAVVCPCESEHTSESGDTATIYMLPNFGGVLYGKFHCLHAHCEGRPQEAYIDALGLDPKRVWKAQANGGVDGGPAGRADEPPHDDRGPDDTEIPGGDCDATASDSTTPAPIDILRPMAAPPLRVDDVPQVLADFAGTQAEATGFDVSMLLAAGIGAATAMLSDEVRLCVAPRSAWFESKRLWLAIVGGPGSGKSPAMRIALGPVYALHRDLLSEWTKTNEAVDEDKRTSMPALYTCDSTTEALAERLRTSERGILFVNDELESWLGQHDAYRAGPGRDRGEWLRLYDGGPHQVDRIRRGAFFVPNWGASLLSATTPAALRKLASKLPDDGLLQRILLVLARPRDLQSSTGPRVHIKAAAEAWAGALRRLFDMPSTVVDLSTAARAAFEEEQAALHQIGLAFEDSHPAYASHVAKRAGMLARLALLFHALDCGAITEPIAGATMQRAVRFLRRQERHALSVYGSMLGADTGVALAKDIARSILASGLRWFNRRELTPRCKAFRAADEPTRQAALTLLCDCGWLEADIATFTHGASWTVDGRVHALFSEHGEAARSRRDAVKARFAGVDDAS